MAINLVSGEVIIDVIKGLLWWDLGCGIIDHTGYRPIYAESLSRMIKK